MTPGPCEKLISMQFALMCTIAGDRIDPSTIFFPSFEILHPLDFDPVNYLIAVT
jgi:hypothetical protein